MLVIVALSVFNLVTLLLANESPVSSKVVWAVNAGGDKHIDIYGIRYSKDPLSIGEASDYGRSLQIGRVPLPDQILYQTERYHTDDFSYSMPIKEDGDYVIVLKFSEVWFNAAQQKVFDVKLNDEHVIVENLDIYGKVGRGIAHDEVIPFKVQKNHVIVNGQKSPIVNSRVSLTFVKGNYDNPKLNAAYLLRGTVSDVPVLPPVQVPETEESVEETESLPPPKPDPIKRKHASGPKIADPYEMSDNTSYVIPVVVAVAAFIPLLYCLCKI